MTINVRKPVEARADAFVANASHSRPAGHSPEEPTKTIVKIRFDAALLSRIDAFAGGLGSAARLGCISLPTPCWNARSSKGLGEGCKTGQNYINEWCAVADRT
jgi:hypothetical protein